MAGPPSTALSRCVLTNLKTSRPNESTLHCILIGSAVFARFTVATNRNTERQTRTQTPRYSFCSNWKHLAEAALRVNNNNDNFFAYFCFF